MVRWTHVALLAAVTAATVGVGGVAGAEPATSSAPAPGAPAPAVPVATGTPGVTGPTVAARPDGAANPATARPAGSGTIRGTVTGAAGAAVENVTVTGTAYYLGEEHEVTTTTSATGGYALVVPGGMYWYVCFDPTTATGSGVPATGYVAQCHTPAGEYLGVYAAAGASTRNINAALVVGGAITGRVLDSGGAGLAGVEVAGVGYGLPTDQVTAARAQETATTLGVDASSSAVGRAARAANAGGPGDADYGVVVQTTTAADGTYTLRGAPGGVYQVCFSGGDATGGVSATGYTASCFRSATPDTFTPVQVTPAATTSAVNGRLPRGGGIDGTVRATDGTGVAGVQVSVGSVGAGRVTYAFATTDARGAYTVGGLATGEYTVCANPPASPPAGVTGWLFACNGGGASDLLSTPVRVTATGSVAVDLTLPTSAALHGVLRRADGTPVAGRGVSTRSGFAVTAADGSYAIGNLPPGADRVCVQDGPCAAVELDAGSSTSADLTLPVGGVLSGRVTSGRSGVAASVSIDDPSGRTTTFLSPTSAPDGTWTVTDLPEGSYRVCASDASTKLPGLLRRCVGQSGATPWTVVVVSAATPARADLALPVAGELTGVVHDGATTVGGAQLRAYRYLKNGTMLATSGMSNADGSFALGGLETGTYRVCTSPTTSAPGYLPGCSSGATVRAAQVTSGVDVTVAPGGAVTGHVALGGGAVPGRSVQVSVTSTRGGPTQTARTGLDGGYTVAGLEPGTYQVCFDPTSASATRGYLPQCWKATTGTPDPVVVRAGATVSGVDAALVLGGSLTGVVTTQSGRPVPAARLVVTDTTGGSLGGYQFTQADGSYRVDGLPAGVVTVCALPDSGSQGVSPTGVLPGCYGGTTSATATPVTITLGATTTAAFVLDPGAAVQGHVLDDAGSPVSGATVTVQGNGDVTTTSGPDGSYLLLGVPTDTSSVCVSGPWVLDAGSPGYQSRCQAVSGLQPGATVTLPLTLPRSAGIRGTVTDGAGHAVANTSVSAYDSRSGVAHYGYTASDGTYTITSLPAGTYQVCATVFNGTGPVSACHPGTVSASLGVYTDDVDVVVPTTQS